MRASRDALQTGDRKSPKKSGGTDRIEVDGACEHNLKNLDVAFARGQITVVTGVSGSGKSSLAFDTVLAEAQRRFFYTLSHYSRQFLDLGTRPAVRRVSGLSPAIALAQNETQPSRRATVGTLTDTSELLGVMFARFGEPRCPTHGVPTGATTVEAIVQRILAEFDGETIAISVPLAAEKKGSFRAQLTAFAAKGYLRAFIDGEVVPLAPLPKLEREEKHTIKLIVDHVKVKAAGRDRLQRSIETALAENRDGPVCEFHVATKIGALDLTRGGTCSTAGGCPVCGFSWPRLDARYFSSNSLGRCKSCFGFGIDLDGAVPDGDEEGTAAEATDDNESQDGSGGDATGSSDIGVVATRDVCPDCRGTGVDKEFGAIILGGKGVQELLSMPIINLARAVDELIVSPLRANPAFVRVADELRAGLARIIDVGLDYVTLSRRVRSLSGGEAQRLKLSGILTDSLHGVLYVLDEPSQGLHPAELDRLWTSLVRLKEQGSTVIIVDHDEELMRRADAIVDLGPGGGADGGHLMARFAPASAAKFASQSRTAWYLSRPGGERFANGTAQSMSTRTAGATTAQPDRIVLEGARRHNLSVPRVQFLRGALNVVTGVSGAGKTSLVVGTLWRNIVALRNASIAGVRARRADERKALTEGRTGRPELAPRRSAAKAAAKKKSPAAAAAAAASSAKAANTAVGVSAAEIDRLLVDCTSMIGWEGLTSIELIDRRPIAKSSISMPASYLEIFGELRDLYALLPDAQIAGLTARSFSLYTDGGRCPVCRGRGETSLSMRFLADARVRCTECEGRRYRPTVLDVRYDGRNLSEVLDLTIAEAARHFAAHQRIVSRLKPAIDLGLGYLKLGQPTASLSGGEAQRLKIVPYLQRRAGPETLLILDEPTTGLHFEDVGKLLAVLRGLADAGATIITIEHSRDVILASDWMIDLGPGAAAAGGRLIYEGKPGDARAAKGSVTGKWL